MRRIMPQDASFTDLMRRVRLGDQDAASDLVRRYESAIRRMVRFHLDPRLRSSLDSMDICQSVMGSFFYRTALGQYDLKQPDDLIKLLVTMAQNKLTDQIRRKTTARRGKDFVRAGSYDEVEVAGTDPSPSRVVSGREMLQLAMAQLTPDERYLADQRVLGRSWSELADELGKTPEALRKRFERAVERVSKQLNLDGADVE
jgi:RNA polymerase sigma-70 factor (ECF subfamily)